MMSPRFDASALLPHETPANHPRRLFLCIDDHVTPADLDLSASLSYK